MAEPPATLRDVANAARVHPATASRALNPETRVLVSDETARRVADAAAALGYRPNPVARSLRTRRSHTIGVLIPDLNNPLFPPMVRGLEDGLTNAGYVALLGNTDGDTGKEQAIFEQMRARHVDGFVLATARAHDPVLAEVARDELPVVLMNRLDPEHDFSSVSVDNEHGMRMSVSHLVALGHTRIAHIAGPRQVSTGEGRRRGYYEGLKTANLDPDEDLIVAAAGFTVEEGVRCCRELLQRHHRDGQARFTAIAVANDMLAVGCFTALDEAGLSCPDDLSLVGFNDMPFVDRLRPPLTTIRFPHYQLGREAAQLLLDQVDRADATAKVLYLEPELVVRGSTGPPRG
ncbi:MAG: LacI family DNA-binding transcriptional regulator [Actinobacteria bacterium]|nr:LacI family DNA-binding transcriptional regulator [Actinomycetota bacterium]